MSPILISVAAGYLIILPILLRLVGVLHTKLVIERKANVKGPRSRQMQKNLPKPIWPKMKERLAYSMKDKRAFSIKGEAKEGGFTNSQMLWAIYLGGLALSLWGGYSGNWKFIVTGYFVFFVFVTFGIMRANPIIKKREEIYRKMFEIAKGTLGQSAEYAENPQAVIQIIEWREIIKPTKVRFEVPTTFAADSEENFLRQFNQIFGTETTWVPFNDPDTGKPGWNYEEGFVTLKETPPLPQSAPWDEHYVLDPSISWSFFPIGLGVENGVELENPKTGQTENVLGFDVAGNQPGVSKEFGKYCSPTITTSPMALVAGGTGGGKALAVDTPIYVVEEAVELASSE